MSASPNIPNIRAYVSFWLIADINIGPIGEGMRIDTSFDFRTDAGGKDPDSHSPTLRKYHRLLWSKPLPSGRRFDLDDTVPGKYLLHQSELGEFFLTSDSVMQTFTRWRRARPLLSQFAEAEHAAFQAICYTIGGMMVFPGNMVRGKQTINGARGCNQKIADRMDLTLECIRRHYSNETSPLAETLSRYSEFFALFENYEGYVDFFLLQDLVAGDGSVKFFLPFGNFESSPIPADKASYIQFRQRSITFIKARNRRIALVGSGSEDRSQVRGI